MILRNTSLPDWKFDEDSGVYVTRTGIIFSPAEYQEIMMYCGKGSPFVIAGTPRVKPIINAWIDAELGLNDALLALALGKRWILDVNPDLEVGETDTSPDGLGAGTLNITHPIFTDGFLELPDEVSSQLSELFGAILELMTSLRRKLDCGEKPNAQFHDALIGAIRNFANDLPIETCAERDFRVDQQTSFLRSQCEMWEYKVGVCWREAARDTATIRDLNSRLENLRVENEVFLEEIQRSNRVLQERNEVIGDLVLRHKSMCQKYAQAANVIRNLRTKSKDRVPNGQNHTT
jgi:hypothetical protein